MTHEVSSRNEYNGPCYSEISDLNSDLLIRNMHASSHLGIGVKLEFKTVHLFTQQNRLNYLGGNIFLFIKIASLEAGKDHSLPVFTFKTVLYLIYMLMHPTQCH